MHKPHIVSARLDPRQWDHVQAKVERLGVSIGEVVRRALDADIAADRERARKAERGDRAGRQRRA